MKTIIFTTIFLTCSPFFALDYHSLLESNKTWDIGVSHPFLICPYSDIFRVKISGDTAIDGKIYKKFERNPFVTLNPGPFCAPFAIDTVSTPFDSYFLREDETEKKVYTFLKVNLREGADFFQCRVLLNRSKK